MLNNLLYQIKRYGIIGTVRFAIDKFTSLIFYGPNVLIRNPNYIRVSGKLILGKRFSSGPGLILDVFKDGRLDIGENVKMNHRVHIGVVSSVKIGNNSLFASNILIIDHNHGVYRGDRQSKPDEIPLKRILDSKPINIGSGVWVGENVCILPGVSIGDNSIVSAGAVVTKNMPSDSIIAGNPAKVVKKWIDTSWVEN